MAGSRSWSRRAASERGPAADAATGRRALLLLAPATFFQGYDDLLLGLALPLIAAEFHLSAARAGLAVSVVQAGAFGVLVLLPLADRIGRRPVLVGTIAGYTLATGATALSRGVADLVAYQFAARICLGTEYALATIVLVELVPPARRGRALAVLTATSALGMAGAGGAFLAVAATGASWRTLYAVGLVPLVLVALARRRLPETLPARGQGVAGEGPRRPLARGVRGLRRALARAGVAPRTVWAAAALSFLFAVYPTAVTAFATLLVLREWGVRLAELGPGPLSLWALGVSGFFVAGRLADRVGRRPAAVGFLAGAAVAGLLTFSAEGAAARTVGLAAVIFGLTGTTPLVAALTTEPFPSAVRGRVGAVARVAGLVGGTIAPALTGVLAAATGSVSEALALVALTYLLAIPPALALPEGRPAAER